MGKTKVGKGMKLEVVVDRSGLPLGLEVAAADVSEQELLMPALDDVPVEVPPGTPVVADKGHDSDPLRDELEEARYTCGFETRVRYSAWPLWSLGRPLRP